jgi:hypothetical protein
MNFKNLTILLFLFSTQALAFEYPFMVSVGFLDSCVLDAEGVKCWNQLAELSVPKLISPTQVSVGASHTCALDAEGVKCWGDNKYGQLNVPNLKSPIQVGAGLLNTCALDADGVKCWGNDSYGQLNVPNIKSPVQVSVGSSHICALDSDGVKCWGDNSAGQINVPPLKSPVQVSAGGRHTCALDAEGVKCWGDSDFGLLLKRDLKFPTQISAGVDETCAIDIEGVKCWGFTRLNIRDLKSPIQVSTGYGKTCVLDTEGVKCWHFDTQATTPNFTFDLLETAIPFLSPARSEYLKSIPKIVFDLKSKGFYLKYLLVAPVILSAESKYFVENYLPKFVKTTERLKNDFGYTGDIREVPDAEEHRKLAISSIRSALSVSLSFFPFDQHAVIRDSLRSADSALAEPMNNQKILDLLKQADALNVEKQKLKSSTKSAFLVDTCELAASWLREKVK